MTDYYVRSTDGNNADSGLTWALAKADLTGFSSIDAAGDRVFVSQAHAESTVGSLTFAFAGTVTSPTQVICGNDGAEPPTALATSATVTANTAAGAITFTGSCYVYGITFIAGTGTNSNCVIQCGAGNIWQRFESCKFQLATGGTSTGVIRGQASGAGGIVEWINCEVKFAAAGQGITIVNGLFHWNGGGITSGGTSPTALITSITSGAAAGGVRIIIENCDFSAGSSSMNMISVQVPYALQAVFRNCKLPSSWSGSWITAFGSNAQGRVEIYNCANASINYGLKIIDGAGNIDHETTLIKAGGASDGTQQISWKMVSASNVAFPAAALFSPEIAYWNEQTGSARTLSIDILRDSATNLKNNEVWIELNYNSQSSDPRAALATSRVDVLTTASDVAASGAGWTTTGMSNPNKQKLSVTFTPQAKGWITARVVLAKPSTTIYVDPLASVT